MENLRDLLARARSGSYQAPPVKRAYVPKNEKEDRPIGLPTVEDKILAARGGHDPGADLRAGIPAVFLRVPTGTLAASGPGIPAHAMLGAESAMGFGGGFAAAFFDTVDHRHLRELLSRRVQDGVITRLMAKWLKAGVWEKGTVSYPEEGTPQGGVICPRPPARSFG
jgi:hypothetical protein